MQRLTLSASEGASYALSHTRPALVLNEQICVEWLQTEPYLRARSGWHAYEFKVEKMDFFVWTFALR
jgi:hypothetical protein